MLRASLKGAPYKSIFVNTPLYLEFAEKGGEPLTLPQSFYGKAVDIIARVAFSLCAQSMELQGLCTHLHAPRFCIPLPHCLALACALNDVMVAVCICQSHLTGFMFVQAIVTR